MNRKQELENIYQIGAAIAALDLRGTNEIVSRVLEILYISADRISRRLPIEASILKRELMGDETQNYEPSKSTIHLIH